MKKGLYSYKIFINKQGPTFPIMDKFGKERKLGKPNIFDKNGKKKGWLLQKNRFKGSKC